MTSYGLAWSVLVESELYVTYALESLAAVAQHVAEIVVLAATQARVRSSSSSLCSVIVERSSPRCVSLRVDEVGNASPDGPSS